MKLIEIDDNSREFDQVIRLHDKNKRTLGFLPFEVFHYSAQKKLLLGAVDTKGNLCGYLLYRISGLRIAIVHLCVGKPFRGCGIAKLLVNYLKQKGKNFLGIILRCRRDYEANFIWPRLGFIPINEIIGRSLSRELLCVWWFDFNKPSLYSLLDENIKKIKAVIDYNVFLDLYNKDNEESMLLKSDWIDDDVILCVTDETFNEINRNDDSSQRENLRKFVAYFHRLKIDSEKAIKTCNALSVLLERKGSVSDESDIKHLSYAILGRAKYFITRDEEIILDKSKISECFSIEIFRPSDFITFQYGMKRDSLYLPSRIKNSELIQVRVGVDKEESLRGRFQSFENKEKKTDFQQLFRIINSHPDRYVMRIVKNETNTDVALYATEKSDNKLIVPLLRVARSNISELIVRNIVSSLILHSDKIKTIAICITDKYISEVTVDVLKRYQFTKENNVWVRLVPSLLSDSDKFISRLNEIYRNENINHLVNRICESIRNSKESNNVDFLIQIEKALWPSKILDINLPIYIVPIDTRWAAELIDPHITQLKLSEINNDIILKEENVYYRSNHGVKIVAPARILWYISHNSSCGRSKCISSCSYLDDVYVDGAKSIYSRFKRFGVYGWDNIMKLADGDINKKIMALRFSHTELLNPVAFSRFKQIIHDIDHKNIVIQAPFRVSETVYNKIYMEGRFNA